MLTPRQSGSGVDTSMSNDMVPESLPAISCAHVSGPDLVERLAATYIFLPLRRMPLMGYSGRLDRSWMQRGAPHTNASESWECHGIA
jgi:hypothetical protein